MAEYYFCPNCRDLVFWEDLCPCLETRGEAVSETMPPTGFLVCHCGTRYWSEDHCPNCHPEVWADLRLLSDEEKFRMEVYENAGLFDEDWGEEPTIE